MILYEWKVGALMLYINTTKNKDNSCAFYFGLEEYLLNEFEQEETIFLLWRVKDTVMLGRHQIAEIEVNQDYLRDNNIELVRRNSGGGAVFTDPYCFQFSFITSKKEHQNLQESSVKYIVNAIKALGIDIEFSGRNDLMISKRKVSGIAEYIKNDRMVIHGTILFDTDINKMVSSLTVDPVKLSSNAVKSVRSRVINLREFLDISLKNFEKHLINSIASKQIMLEKLPLEKINEYRAKFLKNDWNVGKNPPYTYTNTIKFSSGLYKVFVSVKGGSVKSLSITGDFFAVGDLRIFESAFNGVSFTKEAFIKVTNKFHVRDYFIGLKRTQFLELFFGKENKKHLVKPNTVRINLKDLNNRYKEVRNILAQKHLHTVCEEASCPNQLECFSKKTATFMILGNYCTRNCAFCNVMQGRPLKVDKQEAEMIIEAIKVMKLKYVVITSVTRDDLKNDYGSSHFAYVIKRIREEIENIYIEVLIPDFLGYIPAIETVVKAKPDVINHNIETIERLTPLYRDRATYKRSLEVLKVIKEMDPLIKTKSGIMVGLGETDDEVFKTMKDLRSVGCDFLTVGQYLQPSKKHVNVVEYISKMQFDRYKELGKKLGFEHVASGAMVRSSYQAHKQFQGDEHETDSTL